MGKLNLAVTGGDGPFTITVREVNELTGNRYTGSNPTNVLTNLNINYIKDNSEHLYITTVSNGNCTVGTQVFPITCPCDVIPSFVATQICTNPNDPKISVTTSTSDSSFVRIIVYNSSNTILFDITSLPGTQQFSVANNASYRVSVMSGYDGLSNCKAADQIVNVSCTVECNLTVTVSNPIC